MNLETVLPSIITFTVGLFAFIIYYLDHKEKIKAGASIVLSEIRQAEDQLRDFLSNRDLLRTQLDTVSIKSWETYQHLIEKYLEEDEKKETVFFFNKLRALRKVVTEWKDNNAHSLTTKTMYMQQKLIDIASTCKGDSTQYDKEKQNLTKIIHPEAYWFEPSIYKQLISELITQTPKITTTTTGQKLRNISEGKFIRL